MLKPLLVSGWFRVQPFLKYIAIVIIISPFAGIFINTTLAKQLETVIVSSGSSKSNLKLRESSATKKLNFQFAQVNSQTGKISVGEGIHSLPKDRMISGVERENSQVGNNVVSETVPSVNVAQFPRPRLVNQVNLIQKLQDTKEKADLNSPVSENIKSKELATSTVTPKVGEIPVSEQQNESETAQTDPIGSPHPIPWQWILATQEAIGGKGGSGLRYYRSIPVVSPDGKYAIYSRVQMEVKPEMHNSRVNSVLFVEDRQTKRLRVMTSTSVVIDPLLKRQASLSAEADSDENMGVLVPVSWSEKGDRFLARKFVAIFNTADATDQAVIWNSQQNNLNVVSPVQSEDDHEKIAILLGWSKKQPNDVLFRAGELGEENWPLLQVTNDGRTVDISAEGDQAVTFGEKGSIWVDPQLASR